MKPNTQIPPLDLPIFPASWMPIETAPKGKIEILAWSKRHGVNVGVLIHYKRPEMPSRRGGWFLPTHWMPLPSPPNDLAQTRRAGD